MSAARVSAACWAISTPWSQVIDRRSAAGMPATDPMTASLTAAEALDKRAHRGLPGLADHQVTLPVAGDLAARRLGGPLRDRRHPDDPGALRPCPAARLPAGAAGAAPGLPLRRR